MIWFNVFLLAILLSFPILLNVNKRILKGKNKGFNHFLKNGRKMHPYVGILVILIGAYHGYTMLGGNFMFHTGSLLLMLLAANGVLGFLYKKKRKKIFSTLHQAVGGLILAAFLLHFFNPWFFA
jgi:Na+/proline symporter